MSVDLLVKLRDHHQAIADALNEELEQHAPPEIKAEKPTKEPLEYNPENIPWIQAEGDKGPYQRYPAFQQKPVMLVDYINLLEDLKCQNGKLQRAGLFYWLFQDSVTVARKPAKKK